MQTDTEIPLDDDALREAALIAARHADTFSTIGFGESFPPVPSTADWDDYGKAEQAHARFAARAIVEAYLRGLARKGASPGSVTG
jgi:hypothetical protein